MFTDNQLINEMDRLSKFAMRLTRNTADSEDLLQNTILRAFEKKHLFKEGSNVFSWSSKIMYNLFVSDYRRKVKFTSQYDPEPYIANESIDAKQDDQIMVQEVGEAMKLLSHEHQEILMMICIQGMQYEETAQALNIPVGTVRSRLSRARSLLAESLDGSTDTGFSIDQNEGSINRIAA